MEIQANKNYVKMNLPNGTVVDVLSPVLDEIRKWLQEPALRAYAEELLKPEKIAAEGILDPAVVEKLWKDYAERDIWRPQIWYLLMFEQWLGQQ